MRHEPIEISMVGTTARPRPAERRPWRIRGANAKNEPVVVDEAFARFDEASGATAHLKSGNRQVMKQSLVSDLAAQLEAIDRQRERLAQLLQSVETNSIAD